MERNAIVTLTRGYQNEKNYGFLIQRNNSIYEEIICKSNQQYDIIIFHEGNIEKKHQIYISSKTPKLNIKFCDVKYTGSKSAFNNSKNILNLELCPPNPMSSSFPLGYKHMCHFWSIDFIYYLNDYDYIIRIDEDCIIKNFDLNVLDEMKKNQIYFTSPYFQGQDEWYVIVGLEKLWKDFLKKHNIKSSKNFNQIKCPYTNLIIFDMKFILNNNIIQKFLTDIDNSHGIYSNRWGDLPIWGLVTSTLIDEKHSWENKNIKYYHYSHKKLIN